MFPRHLGNNLAPDTTAATQSECRAGESSQNTGRTHPCWVTIQPEKGRLQLWDAREGFWAFLGSPEGMHVSNLHEGTHQV